MNSTDRGILRMAVPAIVSNVTVPLLALVDVAIVGHLGAAVYIGAIAVGGMMFNVIYWIFNFLRMGTSGMTSQALGARRLQETVRMLARSLAVAMAVALVLLLAQRPLLHVGLWFMCGDDSGAGVTGVGPYAATYWNICIWGAPAMLGQYSLTGWLIGMQNSRTPMVVAITQNIVNIMVSLLLVYGVGMKIEGVAAGTLIAQWFGFLLALTLIAVGYRRYIRRNASGVSEEGRSRQDRAGPGRCNGRDGSRPLLRFLSVNRDIFLRTICLVAVMSFFTSAGSRQGETTLAVNTLLMQFFLVFSYVMDGFAYAAEALSGKAYGAMLVSGQGEGAPGVGPYLCPSEPLLIVVRRLFVWGAGAAALFTMVYLTMGKHFLGLLTDDATVVAAATAYLPWAIVLPVASCGAFIWDGVFIGCTMSRGMLVTMAAAAAAFFVVWLALCSTLNNHALWMAFIIYLAVRSVAQTLLFPRLIGLGRTRQG